MQITPDQQQRLERLTQVFLDENTKLNLSAFRTVEQCWAGNVLDSLSLLELLPTLIGEDWQTKPLSILDVGTGGGFPLLPLAIMMPHARFTGLDATLKKVDAVDRIIRTMELPNVTVISGRAEECGHREKMRGRYDLVLSRAVASLSTLLEYCVPFALPKGHCVFWKSMNIAEELRQSLTASKQLSATLIQSFPYTLPGDWGERQLIAYRKMADTSQKYPRRTGIPKTNPLL